MRNLKKFLAVLVVVAMMATSMMSAFAAADPAMTPAEKAEGLGLLKGGADGKVDEAYLNLTTQRIQTAIIYLRLMGKEAEARAYTATTDNFADANLVSGDAVNLLAYLRANPQLGWVGDGTNFNPLGEVSGQALYKVMLTAVGYTQGLDFDYADTIGFARAKGFSLAAYVGYADSVTNNGMAAAMIEALGTNMNGKTTTLAAKLVADKVITEADANKYTSYVTATPTPTIAPDKAAITGVTSDNLIQLNVKFNLPVDATKGVDKANYTVKVGTVTKAIATDGIKLSADKLTATLLLTAGLDQSSVVTVTYKAAAAGTAADLTGTSAAIVDTTVPTVKSVAVTGTKMLTVVYSEPVQGADSIGNYTIDGSVYSGIAPTLSTDGLTATVILAQRIPAGTHKVAVKTAVKDYANIPVSPNSNDITVAVDATAPTAPTLVGDATQTKIVVKFPEAIDSIGAVNAGGKDAASYSADATDKAIWTLNWNFDNSLPASSNTLTFTNVMDMSGNNAATLTLGFTPTTDVVRPALAATPFVQKSGTTFTVEFTKEVQMGTVSNYLLKDKDGNVIIATPSAFTEDNATSANKKKVLLTSSANLTGDAGPYTLKISGIKDNTALQNEIIETTQTLTFVNKVAPTFLSANSSRVSNVQTIFVTFSGKVDSVTATTAANYSMLSTGLVSAALPSTATFELQSDNMTVKITIPADGSAYKIADINTISRLNVSGVKDLSGNTVSTTSQPVTYNADPGAAAIVSAKVTGTKEIKITLDKDINPGTLAQTDFVVKSRPASGTASTLNATSVSYDVATRVVKLTMNDTIRSDGKFKADDLGTLTVQLNQYANVANIFGTKMSSVAANYDGTIVRNLTEEVRPEGTAVANAYTDRETYSYITVKLTENMSAALVAGGAAANVANQFTVLIDGVARTVTVQFLDATTTPSQNALVKLMYADTPANTASGLFNKSYSVSFAPIAGSTYVDASGNILKAFTFTGIIGNTP